MTYKKKKNNSGPADVEQQKPEDHMACARCALHKGPRPFYKEKIHVILVAFSSYNKKFLIKKSTWDKNDLKVWLKNH